MYRSFLLVLLVCITGCSIPLNVEAVNNEKRHSLEESDCPAYDGDWPPWVKNCSGYVQAIPNCEFECPDYTYEPGCEPEVIVETVIEYVAVPTECPSLTCPDIPDCVCELDCDSCPVNEVEVIVEIPGECEEPVELTCWDGLPENPHDGNCSDLPNDAVFAMTFNEPGENGCVYKKCEFWNESLNTTTENEKADPSNCFLVESPEEYFSGGQIKFDGDSYLDCGDTDIVEVDFPFTISAWIKPYDFFGADTIISTDTELNKYNGIRYMLSTVSGIEGSLGDGGSVGPTNRRTKRYVDCWLEPNKWAHVAIVVRDYTDISHFLNGRDNGGEYDGTGGTLMYGEGITTIGAEFFNSDVGHFFNGKMADLKFFNRALNQQEIAALANKECL